jgi:hypothetical protein
MKYGFIIVFSLLSSITLYSQRFIATTSLVRDKNNWILQSNENITLLFDTIKHSIKVPKYGILLMYDPHHITDQLPGYKMYVGSDYGYMIVADNLAYARFEFYNGGDMTYEFLGIKKKL